MDTVSATTCATCPVADRDNPTPERLPLPPPTPSPDASGLGDWTETFLARLGITEARASRLIGLPCGCGARKAKLNRFGAWLNGLFRRLLGR